MTGARCGDEMRLRSHKTPPRRKGISTAVIPDGAPCAPIRNLELLGTGAVELEIPGSMLCIAPE